MGKGVIVGIIVILIVISVTLSVFYLKQDKETVSKSDPGSIEKGTGAGHTPSADTGSDGGTESGSSTGVEYTQECEAYEGRQREACFFDDARTNQDPSICEKIIEGKESLYWASSLYEECYISVAIDTENPEICRTQIKSQFRDECLSSYARNKRDLEFCGEVQDDDESYRCYLGIAIILDNEKICDNIKKGQDYIDRCYSEVLIERETKFPVI